MYNKKKIGIITTPISKSGLTPLSNFIKIMNSMSNSIFLITGDAGYDFYEKNKKVKIFRVSHKPSNSFFFRVFRYIGLQLQISLKILQDFKEIETIFFFIGGDTLVIPTIISWILKKKVILIVAGSSIKTLLTKKDKLYNGLIICQFFTCLLSTKIILYSEYLIGDYALDKWNKKVFIAHEHFVDFQTF
jgi:hypothetical protein